MPFSIDIKPEPHNTTGFPLLLYTFPTSVIMRCVTLFARNDAGETHAATLGNSNELISNVKMCPFSMESGTKIC